MPFCNKCGKKVSEDDEFCPTCGKKLAVKEIRSTVKREIAHIEYRKNPLIAAVLNFFIPGAGYLYAGKRVALGICLVAVQAVISFMIIKLPLDSSLFSALTDLFYIGLYSPLTLTVVLLRGHP